MAMSVGGGDENAPMSDINTTPLVDVMLVMLIIFLLTLPVAIQSIKVTMPEVKYQPSKDRVENLVVTVRGDANGGCDVYLGQSKVNGASLALKASQVLEKDYEKLGGVDVISANPDLLPEAHIRGDIKTPFKCIGGTMYAVQAAGFLKIGFISQPLGGDDERI
jgi:biopolymer transport protein ExbD